MGGHLSTGWNLGQLMYNLLLSGFDIRNGHFCTRGYNVVAFVQKSFLELPELRMDIGDLETLYDYWPMHISQGLEGNIDEVNWPFSKII